MIEWIAQDPDEAKWWARVMVSVGLFMVVFGLLAQACQRMIQVIDHQPVKPVAEFWSGWPTFWIPESFLGFLFCGVLMVAGGVLWWQAHQIQRYLRASW